MTIQHGCARARWLSPVLYAAHTPAAHPRDTRNRPSPGRNLDGLSFDIRTLRLDRLRACLDIQGDLEPEAPCDPFRLRFEAPLGI